MLPKIEFRYSDIYGQLYKNSKKIKEFLKKYKKESHKTIIHIPLHAIQKHIYPKFFTEKRLKKDLIIFLKDYRHSWMIVQKDGYRT